MGNSDTFVHYHVANSDDPYVSAVAAHGAVVVTGTVYGDLYIIADGRNELIDSYHGSIMAIQVRKCRSKELDGFVYVICATALGYIYVHLVCVSNVKASRVIYKLRTGQDIIGIALHPKFGWKHRTSAYCTAEKSRSHDPGQSEPTRVIHSPQMERITSAGSERYETRVDLTTTIKGRRETYDMRHILDCRQETRCKHVGDMGHTNASMILALSRGAMYIIMLDKLGLYGPDDACSLICKFRPTQRRIPMLWNRDMLAWADDDGTQIMMLKKQLSIAFLPHPLSIEPEDTQTTSERKFTPLAELVDLDEFYNTSEESDFDDASAVESRDDTRDDLSETRQIDERTDNVTRHKDDQTTTVEVKEEGLRSARLLQKHEHSLQYNPKDDETGSSLVHRTTAIPVCDTDMHVKPYGCHLSGGVETMHITPEKVICNPCESDCIDASSNHSTQCGSTVRDSILADASLSEVYDDETQNTCIKNVCKTVNDGARRRKARIAAMIKTHDIHTSNVLNQLGNRRSLGVVLCWLSQRKLLVGTKHLMRTIDIVPARAEDRDEEFNLRVAKKCFRLLETNNAWSRIGNDNVQPLVTLKEKRLVRDIPLRAYVSYVFKAPENHHIMAIMRHPGDNVFSIIYELSSVQHGSGVVHVKGTGNYSFLNIRGKHEEGGAPAFADAEKRSKERRPLAFTVIDPCYNNVYINDTLVHCITTGDQTRMLRQSGFMHLTCRMIKEDMEIQRTQNIVINMFICKRCKNMQHTQEVTERSAPRMADRSIGVFTVAPSQVENNATADMKNIDHDIIQCFIDPEIFEGIVLVKGGMRLAITKATLQQYINQLCDHGEHRYAFEEIIKHYNEISKMPNVELYIRDKFIKGLDFMLASRFLNVKNVAHLTLLYIKACNELMGDITKRKHIREIVLKFGKYRRLNILLGYIVPLNMDKGTDCYKTVCDIVGHAIWEIVTFDMPFVLLRMAVTVNHNPETIRKMLVMLKEYVCTNMGTTDPLKLAQHMDCTSGSNTRLCPSVADALVDVKSLGPTPCGNTRLDDVAQKCSELNVETLTLVIEDSVVYGLPSDFELLGFYSPMDCDFLQTTRFMRYGPQVRAAILAIGVLLAKTGNLREAFKFLLYAETHMAIHIAKILCDVDTDTHGDVIAAALDLYSIHHQKANELFTDVFVAPGDIKEVVPILSAEPAFLFSYLNTLYTDGKLPNKYIVQLFRLMCLMRPLEVVSFLKQVSHLIKAGGEIPRECLRIILETQRSQRSRPPDGNHSNTYVWLQKEMYLAEALVRCLGAHQWYQVYTAIMLAIRVDMLVQTMKAAGCRATVDFILERLSAMIYRIFKGHSHDVILQRIVTQINADLTHKGTYAGGGMALYLRYMQYNDYATMGQYGINAVAMTRVARRLLNTLKRGIVVTVGERLTSDMSTKTREIASDGDNHRGSEHYPIGVVADIRMHSARGQRERAIQGNMSAKTSGEIETASVSADGKHQLKPQNYCSLCNSASISCPWDTHKALDIVHTLFNRIRSTVNHVDYPHGKRVLYFFCGHLAHESCQIRLINEAIALRVEANAKQRCESSSDDKSVGFPKLSNAAPGENHVKDLEVLTRSCLICIHHMAEIRKTLVN